MNDDIYLFYVFRFLQQLMAFDAYDWFHSARLGFIHVGMMNIHPLFLTVCLLLLLLLPLHYFMVYTANRLALTALNTAQIDR